MIFILNGAEIAYILPANIETGRVSRINNNIHKNLENFVFVSDDRFRNSSEENHLSYNINILNKLANNKENFLYINGNINMELTNNDVENWLKTLIENAQAINCDFDSID